MANELNDYQLSVLNWINDGCPGGVWDGESHKVSAAALRSRGLIKVSRSTGAWSATVTAKGRYYLSNGQYPPADAKSRTLKPAQPEKGGKAPSVKESAATATTKAPTRVGPTDELIARVVAAGGRLEIESGWTSDNARYDNLISAANRFGKCPPGTRLKRSHGRDASAIYLEDISSWSLVTLAPIAVPDRLSRLHPVVASLRDGTHLAVTGTKPRNRALRLLQALVVEAQNRGYAIRAAKGTGPRHSSFDRGSSDDLFIDVEGYAFGIRTTQQTDRTTHAPTARELRAQTESTWAPRIPKYDYTPSDRLTIIVSGRFETRQSQWSESPKTFALESKLAEILQEIELRAQAAAQAAAADKRAAAQRRGEWEQAIAAATEMAVDHHYASELADQANRWAKARHLTAYIDAMQLSADVTEDSDQCESMTEWIQWSRAHVERITPRNTEMRQPARPSPTHEDIRPFLDKRWGTHGPDSNW